MNPFAAALCSACVSSLRSLKMTFGGIASANASMEVGMFSVAISSGHLRRLEKLRVRGLRGIEEVGALCMGLGSGELSSLRVLTLGFDVRLERESGRAFSEAVVAEKLPRLVTLDADLALNGEGVRALAEGWMTRQPPPLQQLKLSRSSINSGAADALLTLLGSTRVPSLETVDLDFCSWEAERFRSMLSRAFPEIISCKTQAAEFQ
uniref:Uncharacterized protein n=1 Tax=Chromera velia CCMP2878 TaxID=1169474 RepID=A0A0G4GVS6_9ALVE|eukprot:Cvel_23586.t1-p1 / transcript=Cvel_23586.t1 / gene=Cvel_23586 / organism=Chromera_velia_CCMP2878 / gene_product=hypothetical protein / transcript_product=hypothetical protein / location=Cvel_scaffold2449:8744-9361(+) / protein_length=206 / sequence_SO=supercontig / SO=protein_coding / is_pseudo=false